MIFGLTVFLCLVMELKNYIVMELIFQERMKIDFFNRMAESRSEWTSAALHNANTKCNVIMPVWSKQVKDSDMEHSFQRYFEQTLLNKLCCICNGFHILTFPHARKIF